MHTFFSDSELQALIALVNSASDQLKTLASANAEYLPCVDNDDNYTLFIEETTFGMELDDKMRKLIKTFDQGLVPQANAIFAETMRFLNDQLAINRQMRLTAKQQKEEAERVSSGMDGDSVSIQHDSTQEDSSITSGMR